MKRLILASSSERRKKILEQVGYRFEVMVSAFEEVIDQTADPRTLVEQFSYGKASAVSKIAQGAVVLGADTAIVANGEIIGKPKDESDATRILKILSGASHKAITGFTVIDTTSGWNITQSIETIVHFRPLSDDEISDYVKGGEPMDKAGGYGAQDKGALFIERIEGDFYTIVGLPICQVSVELKKVGISAIINT